MDEGIYRCCFPDAIFQFALHRMKAWKRLPSNLIRRLIKRLLIEASAAGFAVIYVMPNWFGRLETSLTCFCGGLMHDGMVPAAATLSGKNLKKISKFPRKKV